MLQNQMRLRAMILALTLAVPAAWAQQKSATPAGPIPPLNSGESSSKKPAEKTDAPDSSQVNPDTTPLTGAEKYTLGTYGRPRSYLLPSISFMETGDTNPVFATGQSSIEMASMVSGRLQLQRVWSHYQFSTAYAGGGTFYNTNGVLNTSYQQLVVSQKVAWRRWSLHLTDSFSYLPDSGYGAGGGFGAPLGYGPAQLGGLNGVLPNLNPALLPNQSIYTTRARRFDNAILGEVEYQISPRASVTATGTYGFLHFLDVGYLDSHNYTFQSGYNYKITAKDTLGVSYGVTFFRYGTGLYNFNGQNVQIAYGRRITGRLAFQVSAGPQINRSKDPITGAVTSTAWTLMTSLHYRLANSDLEVAYNHFTTGGGGVLYGAYSDEVRGTVGRRLTRQWTGALSAAYSKNTAVPLPAAALTINGGYQTWTASATANRPLGRWMSLVFNYSAQHQSSGNCTPGSCAPTFLRHVFGVGFSWNFRPVNLD